MTVGALVLAVSLGVLLLLASRSPASASGSTFMFVSNGDFGHVDWQDATTYRRVDVYRSGLIQNPQTVLDYVIEQFNPCCIVESGFGYIPNSDLTGTGTSHLSLSINTCTDMDPEDYDPPCGLIAIDWSKNVIFTSFQTGGFQQKFGNTVLTINGGVNYSSASVSGSLLGSTIPFPSVSDAYMGINRNATITVQRGH